MNNNRVALIARLFQKIAEAYYAQGQSGMVEFENGWKGTAGPGPSGTVPALNLWMAQKLIDMGVQFPDDGELHANLTTWAAVAADRSRKGK